MSGKRAVVTGASSGIGWALCQHLAPLGYAVTMVARNEERLSRNLDVLSRISDQQHRYSVMDLAKIGTGEVPEDALKPLFANASLLVNCAGVTNHNVLTKLSTEAVCSTIALNLVAPIVLSKMAIVPFLRSSKKTGVVPSILNISSMLSISGVTVGGTAPYAASKAGLLGLTESLAAELGGRIRVNAVLPALVPETAMGKSGSESLPTVSLAAVVDTCGHVIHDDTLNGKFVVADGRGHRVLN